MRQPTKHCNRCDITKSVDDFGTKRTTKDGLSHYCRECRRELARERRSTPEFRRKNRERQAQFRAADPDRYLGYAYRSKYGLTLERYDAILAAQGGGCAICGAVPREGGRRFAVDHDHGCCPTRGRSCGECIRGILCGMCNTGIGQFRDHPELLWVAINYLSQPPVRDR